MSITFLCWIAIDDNTPAGLAPFTYNPSVWSMCEDYALMSCGERAFFAAIGYPSFHDLPPAMITLRGQAPFLAETSKVRELLAAEDYVGWLNQSELLACLRRSCVAIDVLARPVRTLLDVVGILANEYGASKVAILFAFMP